MRDSYSETLLWLFEQFPSYQFLEAKAYKPGLGNIKTILDFLGNPQNSLSIIHVAGTNGKGSTCSFLSSLLQGQNIKVGLFTSPHIVDFRERIRVNNKCIGKQEVESFCNKIHSNNWQENPSFFEITLAMALLHFKNEGCQMVILETGMGGRLDATNIVNPLATIITNISLDHQTFLGETLEEIAVEKAGIFKYKVPAIIAESNPKILKILTLEANKKEAEVFLVQDSEHILIPDFPEYQKRNLQTAITVLNTLNFSVSEHEILNCWVELNNRTGFIGRLFPSKLYDDFYFDVSHNEAGIQTTLSESKIKEAQKIHLIFGASKDKNIETLFDLLPPSTQIYFTEFKNPRSKNVEDFKTLNCDSSFKSTYFQDVNKAIIAAISNREHGEIILVMGSFFLLSDCEEIQDIVNNYLDQ